MRSLPQCDQHVIEALIEAENVDDLNRYVSPRCSHEQSTRSLSNLTSELIYRGGQPQSKRTDRNDARRLLEFPFGRKHGDESAERPQPNQQTLLAALRIFLNAGAVVTGSEWEGVMSDQAYSVRESILAVYRQAPESSGVWSVDALHETLADLAAQGETDELRYLIARGLNFGPEWSAASLLLVDAALGKPSPHWRFYDTLVEAGLPIPPRLKALLTAIRSRDASGIINWSASDWQFPASGLDVDRYLNNFSLQVALALYTEDAAWRDQLLHLSGIDEQTLIDQTPLPIRCLLASRLGADRIRQSLANQSDETLDFQSCQSILRRAEQEAQ